MIFAGAGVGGLLRWGIGAGVTRLLGSGFPFGTVAVNVAGCALAGYAHGALHDSAIREEYRTALFVGLLGGFTTFSAFSRDTIMLLEERQYWLASAHVIIANILCLGSAFLGMKLAGRSVFA
ncbi:MAG: CrcB family protein [Phycisphaeraceae bacterium]|nr:CrcB family protein [Phycisphaeraceae bacterium]